MAILVFVEGADGKIKGSSREAITYGKKVGEITGDQDIVAMVLGEYAEEELLGLGKNGASRVLNIADDRLNENQIGVFAKLVTEQAEAVQASCVIMSKTSFSDNLGGIVAGKLGAAIVSNIVSLPDTASGFKVRKGIFTGKAFASVTMTGDKKVLLIKKNTVDVEESGGEAQLEKLPLPDSVEFKEKLVSKEKAEGDILLDEADIVVSGGRGLKGPENWGIIEDLAKALNAATGCSKPVSDLEWRPHHEHVGQTGVKVSPNLYIAIGISGAIQHLAGVNSSKVLVAINKDPDAPFFKAADYGIVGDAFEVVPKLTEKVKSIN